MRKLFLFLTLVLFGSIFVGNAFGSVAWWNTAWNARMPVTLNTLRYGTADITQDLVIPIDINAERVGFWENVEADGADVRFIGSDGTTEYDYYFESFNYADKNAVAWVEMTAPFSDTSDFNLVVYFGNSVVGSGQKFRRDVYPEIYKAGWDFNESTGTTGMDVVDSDTNNLTHTNTPTLNIEGMLNGAINYDDVTDEYSSTPTFNDGTIYAISYSFWFSPAGGFIGGGLSPYLFRKLNLGGEGILISLDAADGKMRFEQQSGGAHTLYSAKTSWAAATYFHAIATFDSTADEMNLYIDGSITDGGTLSEAMQPVAAGANENFTIAWSAVGLDGNMDAVRIFNRVVTAAEARLIYAAESKSLQQFAGVETRSVDLNFTTINGLPYSPHRVFSFGLDGNITIDFNVFNKENGRLSLDLNYSKTTDKGSGTVIVEDLNLTSDYCPDQDWDDAVSECSFSWNYSEIDDGNYYIIGMMDFNGLYDFNTTDVNFEIVNDVNLLVQVPIDEETFELIDTNTYSFRITYSDGNNAFLHENLIAPIYLSVPLGTILTFTIDENTSDYYPRSYYLNFTTTIISETLQPYLIKKVTAGGGGIQSVLFTKTENNKAVPDIEIRAYRIVPDSGRTLMEQIVTDSAGSATFSFVQGELYTLDFLRDDNLFSSGLVLQPVFPSYQFYLSAEVFSVPDENALIFNVNYFPSGTYIDNNAWADINISITVENTTISDLNILIYLDDNTLYNLIVFADGFYELTPVSIVGATAILNVEVILTTVDGLKLSRSKAYSYNLSVQQQGLNEFFEALPGLVNLNRHSEHLELSTLGCLILTIFICGGIKKQSQIDTGGTALFAMLLLGVFTFMGLVYVPAFIVAAIVCFALLLFTRAF